MSKWFDNKVPNNDKNSSKNKLESYAKIAVNNYIQKYNIYKLDQAANEVLNLAINTNLYLNDKEPWMLIKEKDNLPLVKEIIYNVLEKLPNNRFIITTFTTRNVIKNK